jgi:hypothetical protein
MDRKRNYQTSSKTSQVKSIIERKGLFETAVQAQKPRINGTKNLMNTTKYGRVSKLVSKAIKDNNLVRYFANARKYMTRLSA